MSELNEEIKELENIRDNVLKDEESRQVINAVINQKKENKSVYEKAEEFIVQFEKDLKLQTEKEDIIDNAPILRDLFYNYINNLCRPTPTYKKALHLANEIQDVLEEMLTDEQKVLLRELSYCRTRMSEEVSQQLFIYGYAMSSQIKNECDKEIQEIKKKEN